VFLNIQLVLETSSRENQIQILFELTLPIHFAL